MADQTKEEVKLVSITVADTAAMLATLGTDMKSQIAAQLQQTLGQMQSDLVSRFVTKDDIDIGFGERLRSNAGHDDSAWKFKTNVYDFAVARDVHSKMQTGSDVYAKILNAGADHYATMLSDERLNKHSKRVHELRHADIAAENQWESTQETANDALAAKIAMAINEKRTENK